MAETLLTIETEGVAVAIACSPTDSLQLCYATILKTFVIRELVAPELPTDSETDSSVDLENRRKPHTSIIFKHQLSHPVKSLLWSERGIFVGTAAGVLLFEQKGDTYENRQISALKNVCSMIEFNSWLALGSDSGDVAVLDGALKQVRLLEDAADYISQMCVVSGFLLVASGDGTLYAYDTATLNKQEQTATEDMDFTSVASAGGRALVGTNMNRILVYSLHSAVLPVTTLKMAGEVEFLQRVGEVILVGLSNGQLRGVLTQPLRDLGVFATVQEQPLLLGCASCDESLFVCGGASNMVTILDFGWLNVGGAGELRGEAAAVVGREELEEIEEDEENEEDDEKEPTELAELSSQTDTSDDEKDGEAKVIKPGHLASDSSFSDYFKFTKKEKTRTDKTKEGSYGKNAANAHKKEFFKDL